MFIVVQSLCSVVFFFKLCVKYDLFLLVFLLAKLLFILTGFSLQSELVLLYWKQNVIPKNIVSTA